MNAIALAARERADLALLLCALEVEPRDVGARRDLLLAHLELVETAGDLVEHALVGIELSRLIDVADLHGVAEPQRAGVRLLLPRNQLERRRLTGAVRTNHADNTAARQGEGEIVEQHGIAIGLLQAAGFHDDVAEARTGRNVDLDGFDFLRG